MTTTSRFIRPVLEFLFPSADEASLAFYHGLIRKSAHLAEYGVLALTAIRAFKFSSRTWLFRYWPLGALALVLLVATADELHQSYNPLRTGSVTDVGIDLTGGLLGIAAYLFVVKVYSYVSAPQSRITLERRKNTPGPNDSAAR